MDNIANVIHSLPRDDYATCIQQFIPERSPFTTEHFEIISYQMIRSIFGIPGASAEYKKAKNKFLSLFDKNNLEPDRCTGYNIRSGCPKKTELLWTRLRLAPSIQKKRLPVSVQACCALCQREEILTHSIWLDTKGKPVKIPEMFCADSRDHFMANSYDFEYGDVEGIKIRVCQLCVRRCQVFHYGKNFERTHLRSDVLAQLKVELEKPAMKGYLRTRRVEVRYTNDDLGNGTIEITPDNTFQLINFLYLQLRNRGWFRQQLHEIRSSNKGYYYNPRYVSYPLKVWKLWFE